MATQKKPAARKPAPKKPATKAANDQKQINEVRAQISDFLEKGLDFSPLVVDAGDGIEWKFNPDPMPEQSAKIIDMLTVYDELAQDPKSHEAVEVFNQGVEAIRGLLIDEEQRKEFPRPNYGPTAISFFVLKMATGRDGFPQE